MNPVAIAERMKQTTQEKLGDSVPVTYCRHAAGALLGCKYVRHTTQAA